MTQKTTDLQIDDGIATINLDQPEKHNAFDDVVINELLRYLDRISQDSTIRALVLRASGKHFCAGADLAWMKRMAKLTYDENLQDAKKLAQLMANLNSLAIPSIVLVQGAAYGGAIGLIACCDIALASDTARFCLSEVKLGLAPATIGPYVVAAMGARRCRQLFLTAEMFHAPQALDYGLVHQVLPIEQLDTRLTELLTQIRQAGPCASKAAKKLILEIEHSSGDLSDKTSALIAELRVSDEGQEGLSAFFEKRAPNWLNNTQAE